jgi:hypothetical protein
MAAPIPLVEPVTTAVFKDEVMTQFQVGGGARTRARSTWARPDHPGTVAPSYGEGVARDRAALGAFLRSCRDRLTPARAGMTPFPGPRRVPGLRKEELAVLAGLSPHYYSRLEQGREQRLIVYTVQPDSPTARLLPLLAGWAGSETAYHQIGR